MVRIIVQTQDCGDASQIDGAKAMQHYKTFDLDLPDLEAFLREKVHYGTRAVIGAHVLDK